MELVVLFIGSCALFANTALTARATAVETHDQSLIFSFLQSKPSLNHALVAKTEMTTLLGQSDTWIARAYAAPMSSVILASTTNTKSSTSSTTIQDNVIVKTNPANTQNLRHGKTVYEVQSGDSLIAVASSFGISPATIMLENNIGADAIIKPGQDLTILPINGLSYTLKENDTLEAIAAKYKIDIDDLLEVNDLELASDAQAGASIIIPTEVSLPKPNIPKKFIKDNSNQIRLTQATAPGNINTSDLHFIWPTTTRFITQGYSSRHSGLDISDSKLDPIYASEAGFVEISGWQSNGYGNTILINHGNGFKTRYGHASALYVKAGDKVEKGQLIAKQGHTGNVRGATGIHLHFEILYNGRATNPLNYVKP